MSAHTPGPLGPFETSVNADGQWDVCEEGGGDMVADLSMCPDGERVAKLFAASPDLLAALRAIGESCARYDDPEHDVDPRESFSLFAAMCREAIAKAEGRE